jgi:hypothetical protein
LRYLDLVARAERALYLGEGGSALEELSSFWPRIEAAGLLRVPFLRADLHWLRARAALSAVDAGAEGPRLEEASRDAQKLLGERAAWARALGKLALAGCAASAGEERRAAELAGEAAAECEQCSLKLAAAAARRAQGELRGEEGRALVEAADALVAAQGVAVPARLLGMLAPGF